MRSPTQTDSSPAGLAAIAVSKIPETDTSPSYSSTKPARGKLKVLKTDLIRCLYGRPRYGLHIHTFFLLLLLLSVKWEGQTFFS
jgi:hypothetical protein